jgi:chromosome segregation ATPase
MSRMLPPVAAVLLLVTLAEPVSAQVRTTARRVRELEAKLEELIQLNEAFARLAQQRFAQIQALQNRQTGMEDQISELQEQYQQAMGRQQELLAEIAQLRNGIARQQQNERSRIDQLLSTVSALEQRASRLEEELLTVQYEQLENDPDISRIRTIRVSIESQLDRSSSDIAQVYRVRSRAARRVRTPEPPVTYTSYTVPSGSSADRFRGEYMRRGVRTRVIDRGDLTPEQRLYLLP